MLRRTVLAAGLGSFVTALAERTAEAGPAFGTGPTITITPAAPTSADSIVVTAHYVASDGCYRFKSYQLRVDELKQVIRIDLGYLHVGQVCTQALENIVRDVPLPRLSPGEWVLEVHSKLNHKKFPTETFPLTVTAVGG